VAVPVYERQKSIEPLPGARVQAAGGAEAYGSGAGSAINQLAESSMKMLQDFEDTETLEALNNFKRDVSLYHNAPEKGVLNRQGKDAKGLFQEADLWMQNEAEKYVKKMKSPRMANNFRKMAGQVVLSQGEQNSRFEGAQIRKYRDAEADATIEMAINDAAANWDDDEVVARSLQTGIQALTLKMRGLGDEAWKNGLAELESKISVARLSRMIEADPLRAEQWYKENKDKILGMDQTKVEGVLERETKAYKMESTRDDLIKRYGMNYSAARKEILDNYQGEEEQRVLALYEGWYSDQKRIRDEAERRSQDNFFKTLQTFDTEEAAMAYALKNSKSMTGFRNAKSFIDYLFNETKVTKPGSLEKVLTEIEDGKYSGLTQDQFKAKAAPGISKDDWKEYVLPAFKDKVSENKTNSQIADAVIASEIREIKKRFSNNVALEEKIDRKYKQTLKEHPEMPAEERLALYRKLSSRQTLESTWNPLNWGAFWNPRKEYGINVADMKERGFYYDNVSRKWVNEDGTVIIE
jgi:hypothetical protein